MNGWVDDNDDVKEEDDENEDVDIEEDDDADIIFPYEVQGDQTSPPRDESSDYEFEAEEADDELGLRRLTMSLRLRRPLLNLRLRRPVMSRRRARMREIIRDQFATLMNEFMANMNNGAGGSGGASGSGRAGGSGGTGGNAYGTGVRGARPTVPELTGCTYTTFIKCDPLPFNETEGAVGLCQWFKKLESVFQISECKEKDMVKFAMATLHGRALTWLNGRTKAIGIEAANNTPWSEVKKGITEEFCPQRQLIQDKADEVTEGKKRKGESDRGGRGDNRREHNHRQNQRRGNAGAMTNAAPNNNETCQK
nr:putative reverse transcriptase domain-containing protein [Tanacetum cinerariifolium]